MKKTNTFLIVISIFITGWSAGYFYARNQNGNNISKLQNDETTRRDSCEYHGIDISHHNGDINWSEVAKNSNIQFVYIKATEGATYVDKMYHKNFEGAKHVGLNVGSYHFFRMTSSTRAQFENMKKHIKKENLDLIPMVDVETADGRPQKEVIDSLKSFLCLITEYYGVRPMIYGTNRSYNEICGQEFNKYHLYLGRYGNKAPIIKGKEHYTIWQYSEKGEIRGISKKVDLCRFHPENDISHIKCK